MLFICELLEIKTMFYVNYEKLYVSYDKFMEEVKKKRRRKTTRRGGVSRSLWRDGEKSGWCKSHMNP